MTTPPEDSRSLVPRGGALLLLVVAVGAGMYFLGHRSRASAQSEGQTAQAALGDAAPAAGSPVGAATSKSGRHLAPHDTFYLLQYVSAKTPTGVIGFEPGQPVHLVEVHRPTRTLVVADGEAQVEVGPDKLTNDMDIAALVRQKDQANQAQIAAYVQAEQKAYDDANRAAALNTDKDMAKVNKEERDASVVSGKDSALNQPAVTVDGGSGSGGYGYAGSASYGSPYSYFSGGATSTGSATGTARGGATSPAATGTAR